MQDSTTSREKILRKIRKALIHKSTQEIGDVDMTSDIYAEASESPEIRFAQNFASVSGRFIFCEDEKEFSESFAFLATDNEWENIFCTEPRIAEMLKGAGVNFSSDPTDLPKTDIGLTFCECLIARTGSVMVSSRQLSGRRLPFYANYHIVVAYTSQIVEHIKDGLKSIRDKYGSQMPSMITTITGPSRTSDIEKTLVQGAHGPREMFVFLIDDQNG